MTATTELLLSLLRRFVGAEVRLLSEQVEIDGQVRVVWQQQLIASATGQDYWHLLHHARCAWRYPHSGQPGVLPAPYAHQQMTASKSVCAEPWLWAALEESARVVGGATLVLPVITSVRFGAQVTGK